MKIVLSPVGRIRARLICGLMAISLIASTSTFAQNIGATPLYGTAELSAGFDPDPHVVEVLAGGSDSAAILGNGSTGFINNAQPDYVVNYSAGTYQLGIFVSSTVDTTLVVNDPNGNWHCNDDFSPAGGTNPGVLFNQKLSGIYEIWVGAYQSDGNNSTASLVITERDEDGWVAMDLSNIAEGNAVSSVVDFGDDASRWSNDDECDDPRFEGSGMSGHLTESDRYHDASDCRTLFNSGSIALAEGLGSITLAGNRIERGTLQAGDRTLSSDEYHDTYSFEGVAGQEALKDLRSRDFDPYLIVQTPSGEQLDNDDYEGDTNRALLSFTMNESGNLQQGDNALDSGEYYDTCEIVGRPGQNLLIDQSSNDFDTYLILRSPDGAQDENDDSDTAGASRIEKYLTQAGTLLLVLDSCFSGGFAKDIISVPGRMGLFSSEEDVTSQVVVKFRAGGYLSVFFDEAVRGPYADIDGNGDLAALELSQYLHERYRNDVKSFNPDEYVRTSQQGYQHLVVDRGGVGPYDVIF